VNVCATCPSSEYRSGMCECCKWVNHGNIVWCLDHHSVQHQWNQQAQISCFAIWLVKVWSRFAGKIITSAQLPTWKCCMHVLCSFWCIAVEASAAYSYPVLMAFIHHWTDSEEKAWVPKPSCNMLWVMWVFSILITVLKSMCSKQFPSVSGSAFCEHTQTLHSLHTVYSQF
jgi:hypothetical protein